MRHISVKIIQAVIVVGLGLAFTVSLQASAFLVNSSDFSKPYIGVKPTLGERPLLVLLLKPNDPRMWDQVNVYALRPDGYIGQSSVRVDSNGQLGQWYQQDTLKKTHRFSSAPAVINSPDGNLQSVFALGNDGYIYQTYHNRVSNSEEWRNWSPWSALPKTRRFQSAPAAMNSPDGNLASVFALGQDGYIYQAVYNRAAGGPWGNWSKLPGNLRFKSAPAVMNSPDGSLASVFAQGEDGYLYQVIYMRGANGGWKEWRQLPGNRRFKSAPAVINSPDGRLAEVFALGEDGFIYQLVFVRNTQKGWGDWTSLPRNVRFQSAPAVVNMPDENLTSVFALGENGYLYHVSYSRKPGKGWGAWKKLPQEQSFTSAPAAISRLAHLRTPDYYDRLIFNSPRNVRGYFLENSYGNFTFRKAYITPWLTAQDDIYTPDQDESSLWFFHFYDEKNEYRKKSAWAIRQVERMTSFRYRNYDSNGDGKVTSDELGILWIYPGDADARARGTYPAVVKKNLSAGVQMGLLARGAAGMDLTTIAHELSHEVLHLDDLYPGGGQPGVGRFSLMGFTDTGSHLDPWSKMKLGWLNPKVVVNDGWYNLPAIEQKNRVAYILYNPSHGTREYFIVENRWPGTSYEAKLPDKGIAIWHINERYENDRAFWSRKTIQLEWAGKVGNDTTALWDGAEPGAPDSTYLYWHDGNYSGIGIFNIPPAASTMQVYFDVPD